MTRTDPDVLAGIAAFDTPSVFTAVRSLLGGGPEGEGLEHRGGVPVNYTDHTMRAMLLIGYHRPGASLSSIREYFADGFWEAGELVGDTAP